MLLMNNCTAARRSFRKAVRSKTPVDEDRHKAEEKYKTATMICKAMKLLQKVDSENHSVADDTGEGVGLKETSSRTKCIKVVRLHEKLGDLYCEAEAFGPAVSHYKRQLEVAQTEAQASAASIARIYVSIAQTLFDDKEYEEALQFFRKEHEVRKGNPVEETRTTLKIIEISIAMKKEAAHIHELYESALLRFSSEEGCLKKILKDYALYLDQELEIEKAGEIRHKLLQLDHADKRHNGDKDQDEEEEGEDDEREDGESDSLRLTDVSSPSSSSDSEDEEKGGTRYLKDSEGRPKRLRTKKIKTNEVGETPLHRACIEGDLGRVSKLLAANHPINPRDHCGWLPIHEAANHDYPDIVRILIDAGADVNDPGGDKCGGTTPLHDACNNGHVQVIQILVQKGADVCKFDQDGNTPVDCLRNWRNRVPELDEYTAETFDRTVQLLEQKMASVGFDLEAERKRPIVHLSPDKDTRRNRAARLSRRRVTHDSPPDTPSPRKKKIRKLDHDLDFDDAEVARGEYRAAIKSLRRTRDPAVDFDEERVESRSNHAPLIDACDRLDVDDWLVDDVSKQRKESHRELYESRLLPKKSVSRRAHAAAADWTRGQRSETASGRSHATSTQSNSVTGERGPDTGSSEVIEVEDMAEERTVSLHDVHALSHPADERVTSGEQKRQQLLISVRIEDKTFLIRVPDDKKLVSWLTQETESRYFQLVKKKPVLYLQTPDGAILSPDDLIIDVITGKEVKACIQSFESLPLDVRYQENCKFAGITALPDAVQLLRDCERNGLLNLSHVLVFGTQEKALLDSIVGSRRLVSVDLSFRNMATGEQRLLAWLRDALPQLRELRLSGCGISAQDLAILADSRLPICLLDLSYNPLHDDSLPILCRLMQSMHSLSALYLIACDFTANMLQHPDLGHVVSTHVTLSQVFIDQSVAKHVTAVDLETRFANRLQLQKWKKLLPVSGL